MYEKLRLSESLRNIGTVNNQCSQFFKETQVHFAELYATKISALNFLTGN